MAQKKFGPEDIRHWKPIRMVENAEREFLGDLDRFLGGNFPSLRFIWSRIPGEDQPWIPMAEAYETDDKFVVRVELPGVNPDDVDISVAGDTLIVKGERKPAEGVPQEQYHHCERCYGKFYRRIGLPADVDVNKIEASYENGILEVNIVKSKAAKSTKIKIKKT
jgi:HSP20 family protein